MKKKFKLFTVFVLIVASLLSFGIAAYALPINSDIEDNYFYNKNKEAIATPLAYRTVLVKSSYDLGLDTGFNPQDMFVKGDYLYIVDSKGNRILVLDHNYSLVTTINKISGADDVVREIDATTYNDDGTTSVDAALAKADKFSFNEPKGIFVNDDGLIYVADYGNRRIVVCDIDGNCKKIYQSLRIKVLGSQFIFKPMKIIIDNTGFINVIAYGVNKGLIRINEEDGTFASFFGQPSAAESSADWITDFAAKISGNTATVESVAAEYVNVTVDDTGFIYVTAYPNASNAAVPLKKLSSDGSDVLQKEDKKEFVIGDPDSEYYNQLADVAINEKASTYTVLDASTLRFFTYSSSGSLLYIGGGAGNQFGRMKSPTSLVCWNDQVIVSDSSNKCFIVYELTDYAKSINSAIAKYNSRDYDGAAEEWRTVAKYNSNMNLAYKNLGNIDIVAARDLNDTDELKVKYCKRALEYFTVAQDQDGYSNAYSQLRDVEISKHFTLIFGTIILLAIGIFVLKKVRDSKKKRDDEKRRAGLK